MGFLLSCGCVSTIIRMHHLDANKTHGEKDRWNYISMLRAILNKYCTIPNKTAAVWSLTSHLTNHLSKTNKTCWVLQREIAKKINRSSCAVNNYIKNKNKTSKKIPGRPEKVRPRNKRAIIRDVRKSRKCISQIQLFIARFYVKMNLNIKICELICFIK